MKPKMSKDVADILSGKYGQTKRHEFLRAVRQMILTQRFQAQSELNEDYEIAREAAKEDKP